MFRVNSNISNINSPKKKLLFISTIISNKVEQIKSKNTSPQYPCSNPTSTAPSMKISQNLEKSENNLLNSNNNQTPMKKIFFQLYNMNLNKSENSDKQKKKQKTKKEINFKKKVNINYKQKQTIKKNSSNKDYSTGRWQMDEHERFIDGVIKYGNNWRLVQKYVGTRSGTQTRSHAQKFFEKLKRSKIFKAEKYDFSKNSLKLLHDIMSNLSDKEFDKTLKKLHLFSYKIGLKSKKNNNDVNENEDVSEKDKENNNVNISFYEEKREVNDNNEENLEKLKFNNKGYCYLEANNNKLNNNSDYFVYNYNISNYNFNYDSCNFVVRSRKGSEIFNKNRKNSICEINDIEEQINDSEEYNDINSNVEINEDKTLNKGFNDNDNEYSMSPQSSRKMSLEEKIIATVY